MIDKIQNYKDNGQENMRETGHIKAERSKRNIDYWTKLVKQRRSDMRKLMAQRMERMRRDRRRMGNDKRTENQNQKGFFQI